MAPTYVSPKNRAGFKIQFIDPIKTLEQTSCIFKK